MSYERPTFKIDYPGGDYGHKARLVYLAPSDRGIIEARPATEIEVLLYAILEQLHHGATHDKARL